MARSAPFLALGAIVFAPPASSMIKIKAQLTLDPPNYAAVAPWDKRVPGEWDFWQAWGELVSVQRDGHRDFVYCAVPKAGCTLWKKMLLRASGLSTWNTTDNNVSHIHSPFLSGLGLVGLPSSRDFQKSKQAPSEFYTVMGPESKAYKAAIVRDPAVRLLSSYMDRCIDKKEWSRCLSSEPVTFSEVVANYEARTREDTRIDIHFRNQTALCGLQYDAFTTWDFIGHYEDFIGASKHILSENDMWDEFGAVGWGPNGDASFGVEEQPMSNHLGTHSTEDHMCEYYTPDLLERVRKLYEPDYARFGYDILVWQKKCQPVWGTKPDSEG